MQKNSCGTNPFAIFWRSWWVNGNDPLHPGTARRTRYQRRTPTETQKLDSENVPAIKGLGQFERFKAASAFRQLIENWYVSDFHINMARGSKDAAGLDDHLSVSGDNLQLVANNLFENYPDVFEGIIKKMTERVPGVTEIKPISSPDGRLRLGFRDGSFKDPFIDRYVSDGTIKMFAYLVLLNDPDPHSLLCVAEPENQLYPKLLWSWPKSSVIMRFAAARFLFPPIPRIF